MPWNHPSAFQNPKRVTLHDPDEGTVSRFIICVYLNRLSKREFGYLTISHNGGLCEFQAQFRESQSFF